MLLVELTINSTLHRISQEGVALTNWWDNAILGFTAPQIKIPTEYGGFAEMQFGTMTLSPDLFSGSDWPPPHSCPVTAKYTATTEAAAETLFEGVCHLSNLDRNGVTYRFYGNEDDTVISSGTAFADTLTNVASWFCNAARLNLTLDSTYARASSPTVAYTTSSDQVALKLLSDICAYFTHAFYISGSTLYLVDMLLDNGSRTITEFDFFPSSYEMKSPIASVSDGTYTQTSSYPYGQAKTVTSYCTVQAQIETALDNIITVSNKFGCQLKIPLIGSVPVFGEKISWTDTSLGSDTDAYIRGRGITYNFDSEEIIIKGEGVLS